MLGATVADRIRFAPELHLGFKLMELTPHSVMQCGCAKALTPCLLDLQEAISCRSHLTSSWHRQLNKHLGNKTG